jgi:hypothetical protein
MTIGVPRVRLSRRSAQHRESRHARQHDVEEYQVGKFRLRHVDGGFAIRGLENLVAVLHKHLAQHRTNRGRIVHHQHPCAQGSTQPLRNPALARSVRPDETLEQIENRHRHPLTALR